MALEITRTAGAAGEDFAASEATSGEDTIIAKFAFGGIGPIPVDPTADEGIATGYASEDSAASPTSAEDNSVIA